MSSTHPLDKGSNAVALPVELSTLIIEDVDDDKEAIKACSLVCRTWHTIAHCLLFPTITISTSKLEHTPFDVLIEPIATHVDEVRTLRLTGPSKTSLSSLMEITQRFPNLRKLDLNFIHLKTEGRSPADLRQDIHPNVSVQTIVINTVLVTPIPEHTTMPHLFEYLFTMFPKCRNVSHHMDPDAPHERMSIIPANAVTTEGSPLRTLSYWMLDLPRLNNFIDGVQPFIRSLETLDLIIWIPIEFGIIINALKECMECVRTLRLDTGTGNLLQSDHWSLSTISHYLSLLNCTQWHCHSGDGPYFPGSVAKYWKAADLRSMTTLTKVHVTVREGSFKTYRKLFQNLPDSVRTLVFELTWHPSHGANASSFTRGLDSTWFKDSFKRGLEKIVFMPHHSDQELEESFCEAIRSCLLDYDAKGQVEFLRFCKRIDGCYYCKASTEYGNERYQPD